MSVVVRNCPSPTGLLHIGTVRTALFNYLFAKNQGGKILFRSEDTDKERSTSEYETNIVNGLIGLGLLDKETKIVRQSERTEIYQKYLRQLLDTGHAYYCFMTSEELDKIRDEQQKNGQAPRYPGTYRDYPIKEAEERIKKGEKAVIRFKVPENQTVIFQDLVLGENKTNTRELDDFVIAKDFNTPLYNFCVVVDDHDMQVTHVLRGGDHVPNTPKQILIYQAFNWDTPQFGHFPLIVDSEGKKLSKRRNKVSLLDYLEEGYLPEAILNFLALIGWNPGTEEELFSLDELVQKFSIARVHTSSACFDLNKLIWLNGLHIRRLSIEELQKFTQPFLDKTEYTTLITEKGSDYLKKVLLVIQTKLKKLNELEENCRLFYVFKPATKELICNPKMKVDENIAKKAIQETIQILENLADYTEENIKAALVVKIADLGWSNGQMLWPIRAALSGAEFSPGAFEIASVLGKEESIKRLNQALILF